MLHYEHPVVVSEDDLQPKITSPLARRTRCDVLGQRMRDSMNWFCISSRYANRELLRLKNIEKHVERKDELKDKLARTHKLTTALTCDCWTAVTNES